jgi:hypothetical protein
MWDPFWVPHNLRDIFLKFKIIKFSFYINMMLYIKIK